MREDGTWKYILDGYLAGFSYRSVSGVHVSFIAAQAHVI
jgi:hypothetical protein